MFLWAHTHNKALMLAKEILQNSMSGQAMYIKEICLFDTQKLVWTTLDQSQRIFYTHTKVSHQLEERFSNFLLRMRRLKTNSCINRLKTESADK